MTMQHSGRDAAKILLDAAAVERTLSRIAHELIERNADLDALALVGIHTRGVPIANRLRALVAERSGVRGRHRRRRHHLPPRRRPRPGRRRRRSTPSRSSGAPSSTSRSRARRSCSSTTSSSPAARSAPRSTRCSSTAGPRACSSPSSSTAGHRELPIRPDYVGKNIPTALAERVRVELDETDDGDRVVLLGGGSPMTETVHLRAATELPDRAAAAAGPPAPARHLRPRPRRHRAPARHRRDDRPLARPRGEEAAGAARPARRQPLLRVLDAHALELRPRRQAALGRHDGACARPAPRSTRASRSRTRR